MDAARPAASLRFCPACHQAVEAFVPGGVRLRPNARCPRCIALERHRFLAVLLDGLGPVLAHEATVVDVAPSRYTTDLLDRFALGRYIRLDLDPAADGRDVDVQASLTQLPFAAGSVDLLLCYHVLEHVPDDRAAMAEIARVLRPGGRALIQVPFRPSRGTDEDPDAPEAERIARFGQADHVRVYGADFEDRLARAGLRGPRIHPVDVLGEALVEATGVKDTQPVWVLRRADDGEAATVRRAPAPRNDLLGGLYTLATDARVRHEAEVTALTADRDRVRAERDRMRAERDRMKAERDRWRARHERITGHPVLRPAAAVYRRLRRR